jgi:hypothetical protein
LPSGGRCAYVKEGSEDVAEPVRIAAGPASSPTVARRMNFEWYGILDSSVR